MLHQRLGHRCTISLIDEDTEKSWQDIEHQIYPDPFSTSCQIYSMNKEAMSKHTLNQRHLSKWIFMDIIPSTPPKCLTSEITFSNYILIVDA